MCTDLLIQYKCEVCGRDYAESILSQCERADESHITCANRESVPSDFDPLEGVCDICHSEAPEVEENSDAGELEDLIRFADELTVAVLDSPHTRSDDTHWSAPRLFSYGFAYHERYRKTREEKDLHLAIEMYEKCIDKAPLNHPDLSLWLSHIGIIYGDKYRLSNDLNDTNISIQFLRDSVDKTDLKSPDRSHRLYNVGNGYVNRYYDTRELQDLHQAIQFYEESVTDAPAEVPKHVSRLHNMAAAYHMRHKNTGSLEDLDTSIRRYEESMHKTSSDHPRWLPRMQNLGDAYRSRYRRTGSLEDLDTAIGLYHKALTRSIDDADPHSLSHIAGPFDHNKLFTRSSVNDLNSISHSLGSLYHHKYLARGSVNDLNSAIKLYMDSVANIPFTSPLWTFRSSNIGVAYHDRYERSNNLEDLNTAIRIHSQVVKNGTSDPYERPSQLQHLANDYDVKYLRTKDSADLDYMIQLCVEAIGKAPQNYSRMATLLMTLSVAYERKYSITGSMEDKDESDRLRHQAVDKTPPDHPNRGFYLNSLGIGYQNRYRKSHLPKDLQTAVQSFQQSFNQSSSSIRDRLDSGLRLTSLHCQTGDWERAYDTARATIDMLPLLASRTLENSDKQHLLAGLADLASDATVAALSASKPASDALGLLEGSRGVIYNSINSLRVAVKDLVDQHPALGNKFIRLQDQLNTSVGPLERMQDSTEDLFTVSPLDDVPESRHPAHRAEHPQDSRANKRQNADKELTDLISEIRELPRFHRFLYPPTTEEMQAASINGPVVYINTNVYRCDAILVEKHQIRSLKLTNLHEEDIRLRVDRGDLGSESTLSWLWETITGPVLNALEITEAPSSDSWPHIWWIPTGPLSKFPLHVAGYHGAGSSKTVLDRAISSYSSSIKAILHGHQRHDIITDPAKALLVGMEHTPGIATQLPLASKEVSMLHRLLRSIQIETFEPRHRKADILSHIPHCTIFHFAGHAYTDNHNPLRSYLLLGEKEKDLLSVADLLELNLHNKSPFLAYLSACGTGRIMDTKYSNESIHLINAFQLSGFRHVVGTLWEVRDEICISIARATYVGIRDKSVSDISVCQGLHEATRQLRDSWLNERTEDPSKKMVVGEAGYDPNSFGLDRHGNRVQRDIHVCKDDDDDEEAVQLPWAPYVHFGV